MAELNTRGGAWKEFVRIMDRNAIKAANKTPLKKSPIISNGKLQSTPKSEVSSKPLVNAKTTEKVNVGNAQVPPKD